MHTVYTGWIDMIKERKETERVEMQLNAKSAQMSNFQSKNKAAGMSASEKTAFLQDMQLVIYSFCHWKKTFRVERIRRMGKEKDAKRKGELASVKSGFKDFAKELEASLQIGTPRVELPKRRPPPAAVEDAPAAEEAPAAAEEAPAVEAAPAAEEGGPAAPEDADA